MRSVQSTLFTLLAASGTAFADTKLNLTPGVSPISHDIYQLHMTVFYICVVIGVLVFGAMFYAMYYHRKSRGYVAANFHSHPVLEITWTIVPVIILLLIVLPATKVLLNMNNNDQEALTVKITGYQWKWHYEYLEDNISFFSNLSTPLAQMHNEAPKGKHYLREVDNPIVLPIHKKIRFLITSNDVNHAWWVPDLGVKRDAIAGFINEAWTKIEKPGIYRGQCAELCGINHAFMPIVVVATTDEGYKDWVAKQKGQLTQGEAETNKKWTMDELIKHGEQVYGRICAACHQPTGLGLPPTFPALKGSKVATGQIEKHIETVMNGVPGTAMQAFKSQLTDVELASVITYERNTWGNNTNTLVQPIQIKAYRGGKSIAEAMTVQPNGAVVAAAPAPAATVASAASAPAAPATTAATNKAASATTTSGKQKNTAGMTAAKAATAPASTPAGQAATASTTGSTPAGQTAPAPASTPSITITVPKQVSTQNVQNAEVVTVKSKAATTTTTITISTTTSPSTTAVSSSKPAATPAITTPAVTVPAVTTPAPSTAAPSTAASSTAVPPVAATPPTSAAATSATPSTTVPSATTPSVKAPASPAPSQAPAAAATSTSAAHTPSADELKVAITRGEKVFLTTCAVCHQPTGVGMPPTFPALKGNKITTDANSLPEHINTVMNGHPGTAMQAFKDQLKDPELADVITYERNAWGNNTGTLVSPDQIKAARQNQNNK